MLAVPRPFLEGFVCEAGKANSSLGTFVPVRLADVRPRPLDRARTGRRRDPPRPLHVTDERHVGGDSGASRGL